MPTFEKSVSIKAPAEVAYHWHELPGAFERMTPPWVSVRGVERDALIADGSRVVIETRLLGIWRKWIVQHEDVVPGSRFSDRQIAGPFKSWIHRHEFEDTGDGGCRLVDRIEFELPMGGVGSSYARQELERSFAYRHDIVKRDIERYYRRSAKPTFAITGSSGYLGKTLSNYLKAQGCEVRGITRIPKNEGDIPWNPKEGQLDARRLEGVEVILNLAGSNLASGRWSRAKKKEIRESRIESLSTLKNSISQMARRPSLLISSSGIGYYGLDREAMVTEKSDSGDGFLAELCVEWEQAAAEIGPFVDRVAMVRTGLVLGGEGGALKKMLPPFSLGLGGRLGRGSQWMPWISIEDWIRAIDFLSEPSRGAVGAYNLCSENPVRNSAFTKVLGRVLKRPTIFPIPEFALKLVFGEMAKETLLSSTHGMPDRLINDGFEFAYPDLEGALRSSLGK